MCQKEGLLESVQNIEFSKIKTKERNKKIGNSNEKTEEIWWPKKEFQETAASAKHYQ